MKEEERDEIRIKTPPLMRGLAGGCAMVGVLSTIAMNLEKYPFTNCASQKQLRAVVNIAYDALHRIKKVEWLNPIQISELEEDERQLLREREILPGDKEKESVSTMLVLSKTLQATAVINGEEHLYMEKYTATKDPEMVKKAVDHGYALAECMMTDMKFPPAWRDDFQLLMRNPACCGDGVGVAAWMNLTALMEIGRKWYIEEMVKTSGLSMRAGLSMNLQDMPGFLRFDVPRDSPLAFSTAAARLRSLCCLLYKKENEAREELVKDKKKSAAWKEVLRHDAERMQSGQSVGEHELPGMLSRLILGVYLKQLQVGVTERKAINALANACVATLPARIRLELKGVPQQCSPDGVRGELLRVILTEQLRLNHN